MGSPPVQIISFVVFLCCTSEFSSWAAQQPSVKIPANATTPNSLTGSNHETLVNFSSCFVFGVTEKNDLNQLLSYTIPKCQILIYKGNSVNCLF